MQCRCIFGLGVGLAALPPPRAIAHEFSPLPESLPSAASSSRSSSRSSDGRIRRSQSRLRVQPSLSRSPARGRSRSRDDATPEGSVLGRGREVTPDAPSQFQKEAIAAAHREVVRATMLSQARPDYLRSAKDRARMMRTPARSGVCYPGTDWPEAGAAYGPSTSALPPPSQAASGSRRIPVH